MQIWIVTILIIAIFALLYICLSYFGLTRKLTLNLKNPEDYIYNYRQTDRINAPKYKFIISLSATAENISKMKPVISSLLDQTVSVDEICINIPQNNVNMIPSYMDKYLKVYKLSRDHGSFNNIIPVLRREIDADTVLISLENNLIYGKDFIEKITEPYCDNKYTGVDKLIQATYLNNGIVGGCIVTRVGNFEPEIIETDDQTDDIYTYPEKWISNNLNGNKKHFKYTENYSVSTE